jgi:hypothetical protein
MSDDLEEYFKTINRIGLSDDDIDLPIYRFISFECLVELLIDNALVLVKTKLWEDPYENYLSKCTVYSNNIEVNLDLQDQIFGQCWTMTSESDALWRIYSDDKKGIRIKTTIRKLQNATYKMGQTYLGKVTYNTKEAIKKHFSSIIKGDTLLKTNFLIESLLLKRTAFEHEKEVRVLYMVDTGSIDRTKMVEKFKIIPNDFIDDILLDPRIDSRTEHIYRAAIKLLGFIGNLDKSNLYSLEPTVISMY